MTLMTCQNCQIEFESNDTRRKCCSWKCRGERISKMYKGKTFTEEHKRNISRNHHDVSGLNNPKWKGGKMLSRGYVLVWSPDHPHVSKMGYVMEHRLVMEKHLGRILDQIEVVHHLNENKQDNRLENLQLLKSQSEHATIHLNKRWGNGVRV